MRVWRDDSDRLRGRVSVVYCRIFASCVLRQFLGPSSVLRSVAATCTDLERVPFCKFLKRACMVARCALSHYPRNSLHEQYWIHRLSHVQFLYDNVHVRDIVR